MVYAIQPTRIPSARFSCQYLPLDPVVRAVFIGDIFFPDFLDLWIYIKIRRRSVTICKFEQPWKNRELITFTCLKKKTQENLEGKYIGKIKNFLTKRSSRTALRKACKNMERRNDASGKRTPPKANCNQSIREKKLKAFMYRPRRSARAMHRLSR